MSIIEFKNVSKTYHMEGQKNLALHDVSFAVEKGEFLCLIGPSGEGKTTILKIISGLEKPSEGDVLCPENISMVFQTVALFPWLTAYENVIIALRDKPMSDRVRHETALSYLKLMEIEKFAYHRPAELSGGQRQRVGIARALAVKPDVLLLDEPFSALDPQTTAELHDDLVRIWQTTGTTIVMVSHLIEEAVSLAERILLIKEYTIAHRFEVTLPRPRREQETQFMQEVTKVRREFFK